MQGLSLNRVIGTRHGISPHEFYLVQNQVQLAGCDGDTMADSRRAYGAYDICFLLDLNGCAPHELRVQNLLEFWPGATNQTDGDVRDARSGLQVETVRHLEALLRLR